MTTDTNKPSFRKTALRLEEHVTQLHAFTAVSSISEFLNMSEEIQQNYLAGVADLARTMTNDVQELIELSNLEDEEYKEKIKNLESEIKALKKQNS
ncbi:hypothetical protein [Acinetobacter radioresistens]|uniref:hypothetical protein n=1 Tax=Acinetobacter radioresistens TaxID=40216 RepID=UPI002004FC0A|nr:hypothetical protein [Acinetobacter radioresistens]MCK4109442.1 hypothetical protein [Acinetobacter radioresistens]